MEQFLLGKEWSCREAKGEGGRALIARTHSTVQQKGEGVGGGQ